MQWKFIGTCNLINIFRCGKITDKLILSNITLDPKWKVKHTLADSAGTVPSPSTHTYVGWKCRDTISQDFLTMYKPTAKTSTQLIKWEMKDTRRKTSLPHNSAPLPQKISNSTIRAEYIRIDNNLEKSQFLDICNRCFLTSIAAEFS